MKNIVLIDHEPYSARRRDLFMVEDFINLGYKFEIWSISEYLFKGKYKVTDRLTVDYLRNVCSLNELETLIKYVDISNTVFIVECHNIWDNRKIYKLLSDYNCYTIKIDFYANSTIKKNKALKIKQFFSIRCGKIIKSKVKAFSFLLYKKYFKIKGYKKILSSSDIVKRTDKINHPDYEKFRFHNVDSIIKSEYIVFCDNFFPFHPDLINLLKYKKVPDGKSYQQTLSRFFDYLESVYKMPVIIAAHPKATYKGNEFGNRKIIRNQTVNLVKNCKMIVQHSSNSISYAILANKPIAFISTNDFEAFPQLNHFLHTLAYSLGHNVYNLDKVPFEKVNLLPIENNYRQKYIYTYLTSPETENKRNWDIIREIIENLDIS